MTYLEHITTYVVALLGKGVALSSGDLDVLRRWEAAGVPAEIACRAIHRTFARARRQRGRLALSDCDLPLPPGPAGGDGEGATAQPPAWTRAALLERLVTVGKAAADERLKSAYRMLYRHVRALPDGVLDLALVDRLDDLAVGALERALSPPVRRDARRRARARARELGGRDADAQARERLARVLLEEHYGEQLGLELPSALLLDRGVDGNEKRMPGLRE